jgi:hypothetical protein
MKNIRAVCAVLGLVILASALFSPPQLGSLQDR